MKIAPSALTTKPNKPTTSFWQMIGPVLLYLVLHLAFEGHANSFQTPLNITAWYPPNAIAIVFLLIMGLRFWPVVIVAFLLGNLAIWEQWQIDWSTILPPILNACAAITGGYLLVRNRHFVPGPYWSLKGLAGFCLVALAVAILSGIGTQGTWLLLGRIDLDQISQMSSEWILGDMIGLMVLTPFLLVIAVPFSNAFLPRGRDKGWRYLLGRIRRTPYRALEALVLFGFTVLIIHTVFLSPIAQWHNLLYLCFLPVLWAVLRYGFIGATLIATVIAFAGLTAALLLADPIALFPNRNDIHIFQLFILVLALVAYTLGVTMDELRRAKRSIEGHRQELEGIVAVRTQELSREIEVRRRAEGELRAMNDQLEHRVLERTYALSKARERAERASEAKTRFLQNMSHELHTPLNAVLGFAQLLEREELGPLGHPKYQDYAHHIMAAGSHLLSLVGDLLDMASLTEENYPLQRQPLDLTMLAEEACLMSGPKAMERQIALKMSNGSGAMMVNADKHRLLQVLLNLVNNAIKFSPEKSTITISTRTDGQTAILEILDEGPGIDPAESELVFERFWRGSKSQLSDQGGMGLGLAIARSLTERHGGTLVLQSRGNSGTCAEIRLPLYNQLSSGDQDMHT